MSKIRCDIESFIQDKWHAIHRDVSEEWALGYLARYKNECPRNAMRAIRNGHVLDEAKANEDVSIGMVAGWPTPEQYRAAAARAITKAEAIEKQQARRKP